MPTKKNRIRPRRPLACALLFLLPAATALLSAAPPNYDDKADDAVLNFFKANGGEWNKDRNWSRGRVPTAEDAAIVRDNMTAVISVKAPDVNTLAVGGKKCSTITIAAGGSIAALRKVHVNRNEKDTVALLVIDGGYLRAGADKDYDAGIMFVGTSATHSANCRVEINAGTFEGGITIGAGLDTAKGLVSIRGKKPVVRGLVEKRDGLSLYPTGTLEFVLDAEGVATLDYSKTWVGFKKGATVRVDGTAYRGGNQTIILINAKKLSDGGATTECTGFDPANYQAEIVFTAKGLLLKIKASSK